MIDTPTIAQSPATMAAVLPVAVPREQIKDVMGPGISELMSVVAAQGITMTGPWFAHHTRMDPKVFAFDIGVPVATPVTPTGRVERGELRAATVARTVYRGPYEGLHAAWAEFGNWIKANGYTPASDLWEVYLSGPDASSNPDDWRTELNRPLIV
jgi:effector-binding domain-containing protein